MFFAPLQRFLDFLLYLPMQDTVLGLRICPKFKQDMLHIIRQVLVGICYTNTPLGKVLGALKIR